VQDEVGSLGWAKGPSQSARSRLEHHSSGYLKDNIEPATLWVFTTKAGSRGVNVPFVLHRCSLTELRMAPQTGTRAPRGQSNFAVGLRVRTIGLKLPIPEFALGLDEGAFFQ
jgi:hypothetical protein